MPLKIDIDVVVVRGWRPPPLRLGLAFEPNERQPIVSPEATTRESMESTKSAVIITMLVEWQDPEKDLNTKWKQAYPHDTPGPYTEFHCYAQRRRRRTGRQRDPDLKGEFRTAISPPIQGELAVPVHRPVRRLDSLAIRQVADPCGHLECHHHPMISLSAAWNQGSIGNRQASSKISPLPLMLRRLKPKTQHAAGSNSCPAHEPWLPNKKEEPRQSAVLRRMKQREARAINRTGTHPRRHAKLSYT